MTTTQSTSQSEKITSMEDLYLEQLRDLYSAETQIIEALPKMIQAAQNEPLRQGFELHLEQTKQQAQRLEQIFQRIGQSPQGETCQAMAGLIKEAQHTLQHGQPGPVLDAALIADAQRVEHYEIAGYGSARTFARQVGDTDSLSLLEQTLDEEKQTDAKLTQVAESMVNPQASQQG